MSVPEWADGQLSSDLPVLRARGEGQDMEYMRCFPTNTRELAKEVAAFATSNQGTILLGVSDGGDLLGLTEATSYDGRDQLLRRLEGICRGTVKPAITPTAKFAVEDDKTVLVIVVPKGAQPVYYSNHTPYCRHITEARPAEAHEVVELVRGLIVQTREAPAEADLYSALLSQLAAILVEVQIYGDEAPERMVNPWLEQWRSQFAYAATQLRELAVDSDAIQHELAPSLEALSDALDAVATFQMYLGCGPELRHLIETAVSRAHEIRVQHIETTQILTLSLDDIRQPFEEVERKLDQLLRRADELVVRGRTEEFQEEASQLGLRLLKLSYYDIEALHKGLSQELREIGRDLHLVETMRICMDGGRSLQAVVERVRKAHEEFQRVNVSQSEGAATGRG